jgi:hypothetical protein
MTDFSKTEIEDVLPAAINWDNFKCRCSAIGRIMATSRDNPTLTEKQKLRLIELEAKDSLTERMQAELAELLVKQENSRKIVLSDGCIEYLMEYYAHKTEGIIPLDKELSSIPSLEKGKLVEEESILMLSKIDGILYEKNTEQVFNDFLTGEPDVYAGESIYEAKTIIDMKNCWDYPGFLKSIHKAVENGYRDQVGGYCDITGASEGLIVRSICSMPPSEMDKMKWRLINLLDCGTDESDDFKAIWPTLLRSMDVERIPIHKRIFKLKVDVWGEEKRQMVYDRVKICREWLWKFDEMYQNLNR